MVTDSDAALIVRVVSNDDRAAFELLVRRHQSALRSFLRRLVPHDPHRADDLAQETFIKLYRSIGTYRGQSKFTTWLYRIAYHAFLDGLRGRVDENPLREVDAPVTDDMTHAANNAMDADRAMGLLTPRQRAVFDLHYAQGFTHDEITRVLDLPLGTVKSDLTRGLEHLRQQLSPSRSGRHG
jgi:RNA polymerase sigma-70 factor, ECF subfamily